MQSGAECYKSQNCYWQFGSSFIFFPQFVRNKNGSAVACMSALKHNISAWGMSGPNVSRNCLLVGQATRLNFNKSRFSTTQWLQFRWAAAAYQWPHSDHRSVW
jgi:hypothetical protein